MIVSAHNKLPIVQHWGTGDIASADGMRFVAPASAIHAGPNPKYFGQKRGVTWYNMLSDRFSGLKAEVVPGTLRDSLVILALLLEQETELEPLQIMTDTAAYSDAIFGLFWLLGYQFSPRLADIGGVRLWRIDRNADYGELGQIARGTVNVGLIRDNWPDLIRLAGSLKLGHLKAASVMRMLQVKDRPTGLARALSELGRIVKTIHILRYIDDPAFRRRILIQLNRQELRHRLGRRVHHGERGEIRSPLRQGQQDQLGALGLALNAIVHWNAIYMQETLRQIAAEGASVIDTDIAHLSPIIWRHINFLGQYDRRHGGDRLHRAAAHDAPAGSRHIMTRHRRPNRTKPNSRSDRGPNTRAATTTGALKQRMTAQITPIPAVREVDIGGKWLPATLSLACSVDRNAPIPHRSRIRGHSTPIAQPPEGAA